MTDVRNQALSLYQKFQSAAKRSAMAEARIEHLRQKIDNNTTLQSPGITPGITPTLSTSIGNHHSARPNTFVNAIQKAAQQEFDKVRAAESNIQTLASNQYDFLQEHDRIELITSINRASDALQLIVEVKNKIIAAYTKIAETPL